MINANIIFFLGIKVFLEECVFPIDYTEWYVTGFGDDCLFKKAGCVKKDK